MNTYLLIDGHALMHRAYHALPPFKTKDGTPTNVIYGFFSILHKALADFKPDHLIVCFDVKGPTFRKEIFKQYKATRKKADDDFLVQIPLVKEGLNQAGIVYSEKPGFEADDIIGTICHQLKNLGSKVLILSGDKDILQLAGGNAYVISPQIGYSKMIVYHQEEVEKKFGVKPWQMVDFKALAGDQSDNYSGAKGIGPKTAAELINQFNNIENIFEKIDEVKSEKIRSVLRQNKENILLAKKLAEINKKVELKIDFESTKFENFPEKFKDFLLRLEMYSLANRFFKKKKNIETKEEKKRAEEKQIGLFS